LNVKTKILLISDHLQHNTGVAVQSKHLVEGLIETGKYEVVQLGAAIYHENNEPVKVSNDLNIIPVKGFGDKDTIRSMLVSYVPDVLIIFSDGRFFNHIFEMEDEIHQVCPIMWWHVWDNRPAPHFNKTKYDCIDKINCISDLTYDLCKIVTCNNNKVSYIPHTVPENIFKKLTEKEISYHKEKILGVHKDSFICTWVNRNIRRKRPSDVLKSWQMFLFSLEEKTTKKEAILIMHTDPYDSAGTNLLEVAKYLGILENVRFSDQEASFEKLNILYNISDIVLNISQAEGFGLTTLEAMSAGIPIIATQTGGLTRQLIDKETLAVNGIALKPEVTTISGTQCTPYLNEDFVSVEKVSIAIMKMYSIGSKKRKEIGLAAKNYVNKSFSYNKMIRQWDDSISETLSSWKENYKRVKVEEIL
jgi:glycosyltransferase involved in cell wall biosynthesis